jgi:L-amino acid N-acyltransferase YncA
MSNRLRPPPTLIRDSHADDVPAIQAIYSHHVLYGAASFEETPPGVEEIGHRRAAVLQRGLPYLVAELDGLVVGYAYASPYRSRSAYRYTLEDSVYIRAGFARGGLGRTLLSELIATCTAGGWRQMVAVIGDSGNAASIGLHEKLGFQFVGTLRSVGYKFDTWTDSVLMQRELGPGDAVAPER